MSMENGRTIVRVRPGDIWEFAWQRMPAILRDNLVLRRWLLLIIAIMLAIVPSMRARADETQIEGVTITATDIDQLLRALLTALRPNDSTIPLTVMLKPESEMPSYDKQWHCAGIQNQKGVQTLYVWFNADLKGVDAQNAINSAFLLALTDGGYGGKAFKQLYDIYAARDAQLPSGAPDPFLNRHKFAAALAYMMQSLK